jgi:quercetin dioxygenase-like cupin family protein
VGRPEVPSAEEDIVEHLSAVDQVWEPAPDDLFTGRVWFGLMAPPARPEALNVLGVWFEPGARTSWHRHVDGQVLHVVSGAGVVANEAGERVHMSAGDTVVTPAGEVHWHGAGPHGHMVHLSITTGGPTEWLGRPVSEADYIGP